MTNEEKLMYMFTAIQGEMTGSCSTEIQYSPEMEVEAVAVMKDGMVAWSVSKADILFDYMTKDMK